MGYERRASGLIVRKGPTIISRRNFLATATAAALMAPMPAWAAITRVAHTTIQGTGGGAGPFTSAAFNSTGASLLVTVFASGFFNKPVISDSLSNTWHFGPGANDGTGSYQYQMNYAWNPNVGAGHTVSITAPGANAISVCIAAFSGIRTTSDPRDQFNGNSSTGSATCTTGSITPSAAPSLVIAGNGVRNNVAGNTLSIDSGFTISDQEPMNASWYGSFLGYLVQGAAAAVNPTLTYSATPIMMLSGIINFIAAPATPSGGPFFHSFPP